jgi:hypothetical protein
MSYKVFFHKFQESGGLDLSNFDIAVNSQNGDRMESALLIAVKQYLLNMRIPSRYKFQMGANGTGTIYYPHDKPMFIFNIGVTYYKKFRSISIWVVCNDWSSGQPESSDVFERKLPVHPLYSSTFRKKEIPELEKALLTMVDSILKFPVLKN